MRFLADESCDFRVVRALDVAPRQATDMIDWHQVHAVAEEIELWTSLAINAWVIIAGIVFVFPRMWNEEITLGMRLLSSIGKSAIIVIGLSAIVLFNVAIHWLFNSPLAAYAGLALTVFVVARVLYDFLWPPVRSEGRTFRPSFRFRRSR